ncbi:hypothetical protein WA026_021892 [Henosepilachna vigintioctopunctata]|uniref:Uncharacterized protein n=1 Tax=Henosepilachna vigintioctopunctata TaxID=420089 RepID=A0AAW1URE8_9CUCU
MAIDTRDYVDDRRSRRDLWDLRDERDLERDRGLDHHRYGRDDRHSPALKAARGEWDADYAELEWNRRQEWDARDGWDLEMKHATEEEWRLYNASRSMDAWPAEDRRRWPAAADWRDGRDRSRPRSVASHSREDDSMLDNRRKDHMRVDSHCRNEPPPVRQERNQSLPRNDVPHEPILRKDPPPAHEHHSAPRGEVHSGGSRSDRSDKNDRKEQPDKTQERKESAADKKEECKRDAVPPLVGNTEMVQHPDVVVESSQVDEHEINNSLKRTADQPSESAPETKKVCPEPVLEDDLSEISDDADEILNRDEEIADMQEEETSVQENAETASLKEQNSATSLKSQSPSRSPTNRLSKEGSIDEENMDLDFEEISEDELEEESRVKGIGDALGVDWASLVAESRPRIKPVSSAKKRWESHNVLFHLGISVELAGEDYVKEIFKEHNEAELREKTASKEVEVKLEDVEEREDLDNEKNRHVQLITMKIKEEIKSEPKDDVVISDPLAEIQVASLEKANLRKMLLTSVGPYRRALSARRDLMIRRHLCNLPITDAFVEAPKRHDPELFKLAIKLLEKGQEGEKGTL